LHVSRFTPLSVSFSFSSLQSQDLVSSTGSITVQVLNPSTRTQLNAVIGTRAHARSIDPIETRYLPCMHRKLLLTEILSFQETCLVHQLPIDRQLLFQPRATQPPLLPLPPWIAFPSSPASGSRTLTCEIHFPCLPFPPEHDSHHNYS
jgi:hypothetical protein